MWHNKILALPIHQRPDGPAIKTLMKHDQITDNKVLATWHLAKKRYGVLKAFSGCISVSGPEQN
jgi:hypothetical protein